MLNKGAIKFLAIALAIACLYQLSFTFVTNNVEKKAFTLSNGDAARESAYLDSMKAVEVYNLLGLVKYTYAEAKEKELNLGLDLRGGMNVMLEISVKDVIVALSNNSVDANFRKALALADEKQKSSRADYITLFEESYTEIAPTSNLNAIFSTYELKDVITPESTNQVVIEVIKQQAESAISNSFNVLRSRIDRFGVAQPNIQRLENSGRILVELPGVKEPERVRKLLQGTASLEFWETYNNNELFGLLQQANQRLAELNVVETKESATVESTEEATSGVVSDLIGQDSMAINRAAQEAANPLFSVLIPMFDPQTMMAMNTTVIGRVAAVDTSKVNKYLNMPQVRQIFPRGIKFMWGVKAIDEAETVYELYAINGNTKDSKPRLDGGAVADAMPTYNPMNGAPEVSMTMKPSGARVWARMTADNINKSIAIVLDGYVYSAPNVESEITGGQSSISGSFTYQEATDLANVLKSGKLPAPARIIQEAVVGPSLGQESIDAGMISFIIAFIFVLIYMIIYYSGAGFVASIALITNLFFLFGVLAAFGSVLTLPGIAGIVLTMGMAVDANVIIYERIKEELKLGKGLSLSISDGFKQAYSAIVDGNATTLITGIVLMAFGTGPVQGFATTLVIGIITSFFTSVFITRVIFVSFTEKGKSVSFFNSATKNLLANVNFDFISKRKMAYVISGTLFILSTGSLFINGLSEGIDFSGGRTYVVRFDGTTSDNAVREALATNENFKSGIEVKQYGDASQMRIITQYKYDVTEENVTEEVNQMLYAALSPLYATPISFEEFTTNINEYGILSSDIVGPTVASDITRSSFIAVIIALCAIFAYIVIRFRRWQWALGGVISLFHDAFITIGIFSLLYKVLPFELEINQAFIAAILTIIGYSINDTVVIFDRIREYVGLYPKRNIAENINGAISSTLIRTLNTAGTTLVVLLAMFIFGGEVIRGFVFAIMFGVLIGTYSSIFIATPVAFDFMNKDAKSNALRRK